MLSNLGCGRELLRLPPLLSFTLGGSILHNLVHTQRLFLLSI
jgi:hypothetical protein